MFQVSQVIIWKTEGALKVFCRRLKHCCCFLSRRTMRNLWRKKLHSFYAAISWVMKMCWQLTFPMTESKLLNTRTLDWDLSKSVWLSSVSTQYVNILFTEHCQSFSLTSQFRVQMQHLTLVPLSSIKQIQKGHRSRSRSRNYQNRD